MRHYVHGPDGQKYGPADMALLQQWVSEGRITAETLLEPEVGGTPFSAKSLPGLFAPPMSESGQFQPPPVGYAPYPYAQPTSQESQKYATATWIMGAAAICCCWYLLGPGSIFCAYKAKSLGHPQGKALMTYAIVMSIVAAVLNIAATAYMIQSGMFNFTP